MSPRRSLRTGLVAALALLTLGVGAPALAGSAGPADTLVADPAIARELPHRISAAALGADMAVFQGISDVSGGRRAPGTPGYDRSAQYVEARLRAAGYQVTTQEFPVRYSEALVERLVVDGTPVPVHMMLFTPDTPAGGITGTLAVLPDETTPGCEAADFAGGRYAGTIVLMKRGVCSFAAKEQNAAAAGAIGMVVYNNEDTWLRGNLTTEGQPIPAAGVSLADGTALKARDGATVTLELHTLVETRTTRSVLAQTRTGRTDNVVMVGAHLDSVVEGPGMNANATGASALLETAVRLGGAPRVRNAVRFAFWGSWEFGVIGSPVYMNSLTPEQRADIAMYLNVDMIGSPNAGYFVYDGDNSDHRSPAPGPAGSAAIEQTLVRYFTESGVATEGAPLSFHSDQLPFLSAGIPVGGIFTGSQDKKTPDQAAKWGGTAGVPFDVCYHEACDDLAHVDGAVLLRNARALAAVTAIYATGADGGALPSRTERLAARGTAAAVAGAAAGDQPYAGAAS